MRFFQRLYRNWLGLLSASLVMMFLVQPTTLAQSVNDWESPRQQYASWISDRANLLPWQTEYHLNRRINILVGRTRAELAIATLPQLATGQSPHEFALNLFNTWGVGNRDTNHGVLLLVSKIDRRIEIITGKGLGAILPDAEVSQLIQQAIVPAFQRQDYATGITQGVTAIAQRLEARCPHSIFPDWLPAAFIWLPWLVVMGGAGLVIVGSVQAIGFSLNRVQVAVPTQGLDTQTFANSSDVLAAYPFPQLLAKLFTPNERPWQQEIPARPLSYVWVGGMALGIGLIQGFWQFVLMHPEAAMWQSDAIAWGVCAFASSVWLILGISVTSRFVKKQRFGQFLLQDLLVIGLAASLGGYIWVYQVPSWGKLLVVMLSLSLVGCLVWWLIIGDDLQFKRQRDYCSDRSGNPIQELNAQELTMVLSAAENLARSMGKLEFRGWREASLALPLTRAQVYLVQRSIPPVWSCKHCQSFAVEASVRTVERTIESIKKISRKRKEKITSIIQVQQTVYTCSSCGFIDAYDQYHTAVASSDDSDYYSSHDSSASYSSSSSDVTSSYDQTHNHDYDSSVSSDFGGGSSDGGGAGSDW
ncbi:MAG: TPM domain-containing protein [Pantanalinema sp. GBBB05]|nr:TPM domain-containing protein [Pantanalinema sp. GBBB05]